MNKKNEIQESFWRISYNSKSEFEKILQIFEKLQQNTNINIKLIHKIPAPLNVLINEYDPNFQIEYRDITGPNRTRKENIEKLKDYLSLCKSGQDLYIIDPYFFIDNNIKVYCKLLNILFNNSTFKKIIVYVNDEYNINKEIYNYFYNLLKENDTELIKVSKQDIHDRFYLSSNGYGFSMGPSLNGYLKKEGRIKKLDKDEFIFLYNKYKLNRKEDE